MVKAALLISGLLHTFVSAQQPPGPRCAETAGALDASATPGITVPCKSVLDATPQVEFQPAFVHAALKSQTDTPKGLVGVLTGDLTEFTIPTDVAQPTLLNLNLPPSGYPPDIFECQHLAHAKIGWANTVYAQGAQAPAPNTQRTGEWTAILNYDTLNAKREQIKDVGLNVDSFSPFGTSGFWKLTSISVFRPEQNQLAARFNYAPQEGDHLMGVVVPIVVGQEDVTQLYPWMCAVMGGNACQTASSEPNTPAPPVVEESGQLTIRMEAFFKVVNQGKCTLQDAQAGVSEPRPGVATERDCRTQCTIANSAALRVNEQGGTSCAGISWNDQVGATGVLCLVHKNQQIAEPAQLPNGQPQPPPADEATWKCERLEVRDAGAQHEGGETAPAPPPPAEEKPKLKDPNAWFKPHLILNNGHMAKRHRVQKSVAGDCFAPFTWIELEGGAVGGRRLEQQVVSPGVDWLYDGGLPRLSYVGKDLNAIPVAEADFQTILNKLPVTEVQGVDVGAYVVTDRICLDGMQAGFCIQQQKVGLGWIWKYVAFVLGLIIGLLLYHYCCVNTKPKYYQVRIEEKSGRGDVKGPELRSTTDTWFMSS